MLRLRFYRDIGAGADVITHDIQPLIEVIDIAKDVVMSRSDPIDRADQVLQLQTQIRAFTGQIHSRVAESS